MYTTTTTWHHNQDDWSGREKGIRLFISVELTVNSEVNSFKRAIRGIFLSKHFNGTDPFCFEKFSPVRNIQDCAILIRWCKRDKGHY